MKKKFTILCVILLLLSGKSWSQDSEGEGFEGKNLKSMHANADWYKLMNAPETNLFKVKKAYDTYFLTNSFVKSKETRAYEFWTRHIVRSNYDSEGNVGKQNKNANDLKKKSNTNRTQSVTANWSRINVTPDMVPNWGAGCYTQGTCNMLAINPSNSNQMIAAFIDGGTLWRTTDNCVTWTQVGTNLLARHFGAVVYSKSNPLIVYAASSQGVLKSTDGGATWTMTSYNNTAAYPGGNEIWTMEVKTDDPNTVLFGISNSLYKTIDGGASWTNVTFGNEIRDLRALPSTPNVVLATVKNGSWWEVRRSTDFGTTWASITNGYPTSISGYTTDLALLAVTPAAPNNVWVHLICKQTSTATSKTYDIYKSTDGGVSFSRMNITADLTDSFWQGGWNQAFGISDTDPNLMATGAYNMFVSTNGGTSWTVSPNNNAKYGPHSDVHGIVIKGTAIYSAGDGGIFKSTDNGATYDHTVDNGIQSQCIWGFDQGWKSDIMAIGMYHGPSTLRDDSIYTGWYPLSGADAGEAFVNKGDDRYIYAHPWGNARFTRSTNRMTAPASISIAQIYKGKNDMNDPDYYEQVYGTNGSKVYVSTTNASGFEQGKTFQTNVDDYIVALTNNKIIYARTGNTINKTVDGGVTWADVSPSSISAGKTISHIAVDGSNPSVLWVTFGQKQSTVKVGKSTDGGVTWTNYSGTVLPSYAVNCIVSQMGTAGGVYIGTDAGIYYRDNSLSDWTAFSTNLPVATHVGWIKINYAKAKLRIAGETGIWESDLYSASAPVAHPSTPSFVVEIGKPVQFVDMSVCLANATYSWSFPGGTPSTSTIEKPVVTYAAGGDKSVSLTVTDANGTNSRTYTDFVRVRTVGAIAKTGWTVTYYDSQETASESTPATNAIDGDYNTIWGTNWSSTNPPYPHEIRIDMGATIAIESFKYQGQLTNSNGDVKGYEWYVSTDGTNWGTAVATGNYAATSGEKIVTLSQPVTARYFKFKALSQQTGTNWCKASEIGINGSTSLISAFTANKTLIMPNGSINFTDKSAGNPTSWSWSFPGGTPSTSTAQNPTVTYSTEGIYPVTLSVTSASGTDIVTKNSYINVSTFVPQTGWSLKYVDSEEISSETTPATNAFDGSNSTFWGTNWSSTNPSPPHEIQIDMGTNYNVNGFNYVPRQNGANGRIANYEFYVSTDGTNWNLTNSGTWANDAVEKSLNFTAVSVRYIRLRALSEVNGNPWTAVGEIKMKLAGDLPPVADFNGSATAITTGQAVTFTDLTTNTPTSWSWTFTGGTPSTSTAQNPTVTYNTAGTYAVALTATNSAGNNTMTKTAYITVTAPLTYCASQSTSFTNDYIKTVTIGATTKTSVGSTYSNYTSTVIPLTSGASTTYLLAPKGTTRTEYWRVYIDYNHNGVFTDVGELVINVNGKTTKTGSFTVLTTALTGQTRMRVMQKYSTALTGPCEAFTNGEVEDYTVNISINPVVLSVASIDNNKAVDVSIYSYRNEIKIDLGGEQNDGKVFIYDIMGHQVETKEIFKGLNTIPVYNTGIYIVKVIVDNNVITRKVIAE
ncbi:discoidin domain-containing protein [Flavobacterium sp. ZB4P13]|uniref:discoidin domain-containing protein n=1 Tax=Flavobacterium sp. ZB4P13 TaxID=3401728 RepID=UPI003AB03A14